MPYRAQINERGVITKYKDTDTGEVITAQEFERRLTQQQGGYYVAPPPTQPQMYANPPASQQGVYGGGGVAPLFQAHQQNLGNPQGYGQVATPAPAGGYPAAAYAGGAQPHQQQGYSQPQGYAQQPGQAPAAAPIDQGPSPLVQPGAQMLNGQEAPAEGAPQGEAKAAGKTLRMEGVPKENKIGSSHGYRTHGFLDATSIAILLPTLVLLALIIAAAHKKRLFPWQTIRTFNPPSGLMGPRDYERSFVCPPNLRRHGRMGKRNPQATWTDADGIVIPFGFLARTHLPVTIPLGRLPNKNMFIVAPSGSGKTTLMRAVMKALLAKPCVMIALEAKANDPNLDEKKESFKHTVLPEAKAAGFESLYFNPLDQDSICWNPLDVEPTAFASSIVQDVNSLPPEEQHWAERDHGYIAGLVKLLKWGAVMVVRDDENGQAAEVQNLPCNPRALMRLVNNRRNIVESLRRLKSNPNVDQAELNEQTMTLSSIIRTDTDWDKNIQGVRGRLRMFRNESVLRVSDQSNVDLKVAMHRPTVLIFGAPASLGPDAESMAACFVYQLQQALHTRYGTASVLPLFAFFDEYQTLNIDLAGRLSAIVRGANGGLTVILQNISQIAKNVSSDPTASGASELKTLFSNCAVRVCLHNADESTAKFFSDEIGKHAVIVPGISDHYEANGFGIFPTSWNRIHSQQVVARVDADSIKRMEKHHALVYLSPAGDPEFGETKPFMVDLRGIEEIARLHLLHNVTNRAQDEEMGAIPGGVMPGAAVVPIAKAVGHQMVDAAVDAAAAAMPGVEQVELATSAVILPPQGVPGVPGVPGFAQQQAPAAPQRPAFPSGNLPGVSGAAPFPGQGPLTAPVQPQAPQMQQAPQMPQAQQQAPAPQQAAPQEARTCPHCSRNAGKGRFCIECGKFVGPAQGAAPTTQRQAVAEGATAPSSQFGQYPQGAPPAQQDQQQYAQQQQAAYPQPPQAPQMPQPPQPPKAPRKALTSLHADLSQFGVQPNQNRNKPKAGVEF